MSLFPNFIFILSTIGFMPIGFFPIFSFVFLLWALKFLSFNPKCITPLQFSVVTFLFVCLVSFVNSFFVLQNLGLPFDIKYMLNSIVSISSMSLPFIFMFCKFNFNLQQFFESICFACGTLFLLVLIVGFEHFISLDYISLRHPDTPFFSGWPTRIAPIFSIPFFYALYSLNVSRRLIFNLLAISLCLFIFLVAGTRSVLIPVLLISLFFFFFSSGSRIKKVIIILIFLVILVNVLFYFSATIRLSEIIRIFNNLGSANLDLIFDAESSLGYRFHHIWPFIIENVMEFSPVLGFGGLGPSYLPVPMYSDYPYITPLMASAESQYFDVFFRSGYLGLLVYLVFWLLLIKRTWFLYSVANTFASRRLFFSFGFFYVILIFQSLTTETLRFLPLSIIFFISLNLITNGKKQS